MTKKRRRVYDHRIKEAIIRSRNPHLFPELKIPPSTARAWIQRGLGEVVSLHPDNASEDVLRDRIAALERRVRTLGTLLRLTMVLTRISGCGLDRHLSLLKTLSGAGEQVGDVAAAPLGAGGRLSSRIAGP